MKILHIAVAIISAIFILVIIEIALRFSRYKYFLPQSDDNLRFYYKTDALTGYDITENYPPKRCVSFDYDYMVWSNELGCFDEPYKGEKDYIILTGDSFAWGYAPFEDKYGTLIEKYLDYRVLKCGVSGYGVRQELSKIKKIIEKIKTYPKLIILSYFILNDFQDDWLFPEYTVIDGYRLKKIKIKTAGNIISKETISDDELKKQIQNYKESIKIWKFAGIKDWLSSHSIIYHLLRNVPAVYKIASRIGLVSYEYAKNDLLGQIEKFPNLKEPWQAHLNNIKEIDRLAKADNAKFLIILIPPKVKIYGLPGFDSGYLEEYNKKLISFFSKEGIDYLDLSDFFKKCAKINKGLYLYDGHLNIEGNRLAGLLVTKHIIEHNLLEIPKLDEIKIKVNNDLTDFGIDKN